jgi:16S rRNA (cytosine967-C5)-methyltransferase
VSAARDLAFAVVHRALDEGAYADRAFGAEAARAKLPTRERAFAMHLAFGTIQRLRTLDAALEQVAGRPPQRLEHKLAHALRLGTFELLFSATPARAAVDEAVSLVRKRVGERGTGLTNAVLRRIAAEGPAWYAALPQETAEQAALRHSLPDWLAALWFEAYGAERGRSLCAAANEPAEVVLRPNLLKAAPAELETALSVAGIPFHADDATGALVLDGPFEHAGEELLGRGLAVAQSRGSILAAAALEARPGERILDLCAAPGGKTLQLAAAGARVTAVERNAGRARALQETVERAGADVEVVEADAREYTADEPFDAILLDAPCSGNGVLAGRPDARWRRSAGDVAELAALQVELLRHARTLVKDGGRLLYAVCTLSPDENERVLAAAGLEPGFERRTWPDTDHTDGFYVAGIPA